MPPTGGGPVGGGGSRQGAGGKGSRLTVVRWLRLAAVGAWLLELLGVWAKIRHYEIPAGQRYGCAPPWKSQFGASYDCNLWAHERLMTALYVTVVCTEVMVVVVALTVLGARLGRDVPDPVAGRLGPDPLAAGDVGLAVCATRRVPADGVGAAAEYDDA